MLAGNYSASRGSFTNFLDIGNFLSQTHVGLDKDGNPLIASSKTLGGQPRKWVHIGPMTWRDANGHDLLTANVADGKATRFSYGELAPIIDFDRTPGYRSTAWILPLLYASLAVLLITVLLWPTRALVRRKYKAEFGLERNQLWTYRSSRIAAIAILAVLIGWTVAIQMLFGDLGNEASMNAVLVLLELLSIIVFIGGFLVMLWYAYTAWKSGWRWPGKVWSILLVISAGMVLYVGLVFKLIGLTTNY
jgi:hypothetical protein